MNINESLEIQLNRLDRENLKISLNFTFLEYKKYAYTDIGTVTSKLKMWLELHDFLAVKWGYYGDLDIYIDEYEKKLKQLLKRSKPLIIKEIVDGFNLVSQRNIISYQEVIHQDF